jgi:pyruvate/2-oxoglutarate dehydrogenase complex dihydrolipoamide dehydrogenase (E3) component
MKTSKIVLLVLIAVLVAVFFAFNLQHYFSLDSLKAHKTITTRSIVIVAGDRPFIPPIPGIEQINYLTSDTIWNLSVLPKRLLVMGRPLSCLAA